MFLLCNFNVKTADVQIDNQKYWNVYVNDLVLHNKESCSVWKFLNYYLSNIQWHDFERHLPQIFVNSISKWIG